MMATSIKYNDSTDVIELHADGAFETGAAELMDSVAEYDTHSVREVQGWAPYTHLVVGTSDSDPECWRQVAYLTVGKPVS